MDIHYYSAFLSAHRHLKTDIFEAGPVDQLFSSCAFNPYIFDVYAAQLEALVIDLHRMGDPSLSNQEPHHSTASRTPWPPLSHTEIWPSYELSPKDMCFPNPGMCYPLQN